MAEENEDQEKRSFFLMSLVFSWNTLAGALFCFLFDIFVEGQR